MTPAQARADSGELLDSDCYAHHEQTAAPDPEACTFGFFDGDTVVLYGDSHAAQWFGAAVEVADRHDWRLLPVTKADCPPGGERVLDADLSSEYTECAAWHAHAMELIRSQEPILVLVAARSDGYRIVGDDGEPLSSLASVRPPGSGPGRGPAGVRRHGCAYRPHPRHPGPGVRRPGLHRGRRPGGLRLRPGGDES